MRRLTMLAAGIVMCAILTGFSVPAAVSAAAQGCTVSVTDSKMLSESRIQATVQVWCGQPTIVSVYYQAMEADNGPDQQMSAVYGGDLRYIEKANTWYQWSYWFKCYDMDTIGKEEPYVHARVQHNNLATGTLRSPWADGAQLSADCTYDEG